MYLKFEVLPIDVIYHPKHEKIFSIDLKECFVHTPRQLSKCVIMWSQYGANLSSNERLKSPTTPTAAEHI